MKRIILSLAAGLASALLLGGVGAAGASADTGPNLLANPGLEVADGTGGPAWWSPSTWNTVAPATAPKFTWSDDAHTGSHSVRVDVSDYTDGDSKWVPDLVPVKGNTYYNFSDWYKSDRSSAVSVYYVLSTDKTDDDGHWSNLFSGISPASDWTQYKTGFTMPANAIKAQFVHFIAGNGYLETDDYSLTEQDSPPGWSKPMISLTFDDGSQGDYDNARPVLNAKGFKTTQYLPTAGLTSTPHDPFLMTKDEISTLAKEGNEIGGHSVTHPFLTTVSDTQLHSELVDSKQVLEAIPGVGTVHNFAYPYGDYDARVIAAEQAAGYRSGRSVEEGYNSRLDLEPYDIRVQNMTPETTLDQFKSWVDYAKAHNYWLVIVYHEVQQDSVPLCTNPAPPATDPDPCLGPYDTKLSSFQSQLDYISSSGLGQDVVTVQQALDATDAEMRPVAGTVKVTPTDPATGAALTATPNGFSDPDNDALTYQYQWTVNGTPIAGATSPTFDLSTAGHGDHGDVVSVDVTAKDPGGRTSAGVSDSVTVADTPPVKGAVTISPASPVAGATLTAAPSGFSDADGDPLTYTYAWFRNDQPIAGATTSTLPASAYAAGDQVSVQARANDGHGATSDPATATVTVAKATVTVPPTGTKPPTGTTPPIGTTPPTGTTPPHATPAPKPIVDKTAPKIVVSSPKAGVYKIGRWLKVNVAVSDKSGAVRWTATISRIGSKAHPAKQGGKLHLSRAGRYVLRVTAKDRWGNTATKTVHFRVVRK